MKFLIILIGCLCMTGCSTPGQRAGWAAVFQGMAGAGQNSMNQYQMNQLQNQQFQQQQQIYNLQHP